MIQKELVDSCCALSMEYIEKIGKKGEKFNIKCGYFLLLKKKKKKRKEKSSTKGCGTFLLFLKKKGHIFT